MASLNHIQLIGRLGKDPEERTTPKGTKLITFTMAVDHIWKTTAGETKKNTDWFFVEVWGKYGETLKKLLGKGRLIFLEGRLKTDRYEEKGETKYFTKVIASNVQVLDRKHAEEDASVVIPVEDEPAAEE